MSSTFKRLPNIAKPTHYDVWLKPDLIQLTFQGTVQVTLKVNSVLYIYLLFIIFF